MSDEKIPRDVKILHLIMASMGVTSYQDQVPLQLLDFAHRYTIQIIQDALIYSDYASQSISGQSTGLGSQNSQLSVDDVKLAVSSRVAYQFKPATPKDLLMSLAAERNKRALPTVPNSYGLRLPPEKYCLTGRERDIDDDDDVVIAGYEKIDAAIAAEYANKSNEMQVDEDDADPNLKTENTADHVENDTKNADQPDSNDHMK